MQINNAHLISNVIISLTALSHQKIDNFENAKYCTKSFLLCVYKVGIAQAIYSPIDQAKIGPLLYVCLPALNHQIDKIHEFNLDKSQEARLERSAFQFLFDEFSYFPMSSGETTLNEHLAELQNTELFKEWDQNLEILPFIADYTIEPPRNIPKIILDKHWWW